MRGVLIPLCVVLAVSIVPAERCAADGRHFIRGDADDSGHLQMNDAIRILRFLFPSAPWDVAVVPCLEAADANDDNRLNVTDVIYILSHLFRGGPAPPAPFPECGADPSADALGCEDNYQCSWDGLSFYGIAVEADGLFFLVDRSRFMQGNGEFGIAKREIIHVISAARPGVEIGIVFVDGGVMMFPDNGKPFVAGDAGAARTAIEFIHSVAGGDDACVREGLRAGLAFAEASTVSKKAVYYVGCGAGVCEGGDEAAYLDETLKDVAALNAGRFPVFTIGQLVRSSLRDQFLRDLASQNSGIYTPIAR